MRISMLECREDFYTILNDTLVSFARMRGSENIKKQTFHVNRYLNFIAVNTLPRQMFKILSKEYGRSLVVWKRPIQSLYVGLAISPFFRPYLAHRKIKLPGEFANFLILGGNHRIRIFSPDLKSTLVLLKDGESDSFILNEIQLKSTVRLSYAPEILDCGKNWIKEVYFEGVPLNRVSDSVRQAELIKQAIALHLTELLKPTLSYQPAEVFVLQKLDAMKTIIRESNIKADTDSINNIESTFALVANDLLEVDSFPVSWTHGDFQMANILLCDTIFKAIDWEAADKRFYLYDLFVILGGIRIHGNFQLAIREFEQKFNELHLGICLPDKWRSMLAFEELCFSVHEDFSVNFYESGKSTDLLANTIKETFQG